MFEGEVPNDAEGKIARAVEAAPAVVGDDEKDARDGLAIGTAIVRDRVLGEAGEVEKDHRPRSTTRLPQAIPAPRKSLLLRAKLSAPRLFESRSKCMRGGVLIPKGVLIPLSITQECCASRSRRREHDPMSVISALPRECRVGSRRSSA